jgi:hypothetical protein
LRHDFRAIYGCSYDEVPVEEAIDLINTLPDGSLYVSSKYPARSWTKEQHSMADLRDQIYAISYGLCGIPANKIPHVMRPAEQIANAHARLKSSEARKRIEETKWEEV